MSERPQMVLPFAEKEYVDTYRACRILGVSWTTLRRMACSGLLDMIDYRYHGRKRIRYQSIVEFCDALRTRYNIPDRRPTLSAPYLRHKDEDLLPFALRDTMKMKEAASALGFSQPETVLPLVEQGCFEAYRIVVGAPWRISRPAFIDYARQAMRGVRGGPTVYKEASILEA